MLLSYTFSNFYSFAEPTTVSFVLNQRDKVTGWERRSPSSQRLTTAIAVMGANGAGKSNLIKAVPFLAWFARDSFDLKPDEEIAFVPHQASQNIPAEFTLEIDDENGICWRYVLKALPDKVLYEALHRKRNEHNSRYSYVFTRNWAGNQYAIKQSGFGLSESEALKVRPNVSLISWARQYGVPLASWLTDFTLTTNISMLGRTTPTSASVWHAAESFNANQQLCSQMRNLLKAWDFGLSDVEIRQFQSQTPETSLSARWYPFGIHKSASGSFELPFAFESSGTQTAFVLLWHILPALARGGIAFIDELESDLHPHMIEPILRLFHDADTNPHSAQIIFTCHSTEVLRLLQRAQVVFVEKNDCLSTAYRGDDIDGLKSEHNLYAKYMAGALGAVPQI